ncbi:MAG TPA: formimidoylglutamase [Flavipsychrobacter sp.]|nr:formimidoylglutamase [Flavipsychrobacter sp.]
MSHFKVLTSADIKSLVARREGEIKLGETVQTVQSAGWKEELQQSPARFVLVGIPEDIGVKANFGIGGTHSLWEPALKAILNVQQTDRIQGGELLALGAFDFADWMENCEGKGVGELRQVVAAIDDEVFPVIEAIVTCGKIPIVIGGGHNNAYPILKGVSRAKEEAVNCVNLDAHSDYRAMEGRHSGNGFRYAKAAGFLRRYMEIGLHENYNGAAVIKDLTGDPDIHFYSYEDIFLHEHIDYKTVLGKSSAFVNGYATGIELDMDCITNVLSSAATPCGVSPLQARQYVSHFARFSDAAYLHLTEGAVRLEDGRENLLTPKLAAYLVTDFIKGIPLSQTFFTENAV